MGGATLVHEWKRDVLEHYQAAAEDYSDQYDDLRYKGYPANRKRLELILSRLQECFLIVNL